MSKKTSGDNTKSSSQQDSQQRCPYSGTSSGASSATHSQPGYASTESNTYWNNVLPPLLRQGKGRDNQDVLYNLGPLAQLIGTWVSTPQNGYNVMPLPEATAKNGFILKNFPYYEEITFSAIADKVPNRGGKFQQNSYTLFYEQRVFFSQGPEKDQLVHAENGSWLHLKTGPQLVGPVGISPIPSPPAPEPIPPQNPAGSIVKQVSVTPWQQHSGNRRF
ncbi:heme-binding beta-barrel domain-containing protein [Endozoicomonas lisbonensis]|uniref:heme-binding beta-barrel domain-containing protein n=1 Tax=Endozoicomonas lisbonensis TaxID=3120522 RepID=UPI003390969D